MNWHLDRGGRYARRALPLADRHYSRQSPGSPQFVGPGVPLVLLTAGADALWVSLAQKPEFVKHAWPGAWQNPYFRNESQILSSLLIREAVAATLAAFGAPPPLGFVSFVDQGKVRKKRDPGRCFIRAGFRRAGFTKEHGHLVLQLLPEDMPQPSRAIGSQFALFEAVKS